MQLSICGTTSNLGRFLAHYYHPKDTKGGIPFKLLILIMIYFLFNYVMMQSCDMIEHPMIVVETLL
jgi:hypothetical protein